MMQLLSFPRSKGIALSSDSLKQTVIGLVEHLWLQLSLAVKHWQAALRIAVRNAQRNLTLTL